DKGGVALWMFTYGDMVTLLLVFFIMLFSFSTIDAQKWQSLVKALSGNIGILDGGKEIKVTEIIPTGQVTPKSTASLSPGPTPTKGSDYFFDLYIQIKGYVDKNGLNSKLDLINMDHEILIRFRDNAIFDSGKADIKPEMIVTLKDIAGILREYQDKVEGVRIEGHTDNVPIQSSRYPSNWELSTARAVQVLRFFIEQQHMKPAKLSAVGYGEYHPVANNDTEQNRALNRRVDILIVKSVEAGEG
ncbi:MAG TPA: flagellar motor protein MotB, partial [Clostridia bacterium]|nr:flagellar motor protein MotB [Clostridia bacterium]